MKINCVCITIFGLFFMQQHVCAMEEKLLAEQQEVAAIAESSGCADLGPGQTNPVSCQDHGANKSVVYIKNNSGHKVRISVGPHYPSSILLYPNQVLEFPSKRISTVTASTYGKYSHYLTGLVAELDMAGLFQDHPEYVSKDCLINITYDDNVDGQGFWAYACYALTRGKWMLTVGPVESIENVENSHCKPKYSQNLYQAVVNSCVSKKDETNAQQAAMIWSVFPRAAEKIEHDQQVYPYNILGLDIGGLIATDAQLRNWGKLLSRSLRKKYDCINCNVIWNAVDMMIADSIESLKLTSYAILRKPDYPITLLQILSKKNSDQENVFSEELLNQLKEKVQGDESAQSILNKLETAARAQGLIGEVKSAPPPPPPPPPLHRALTTTSFAEREIANFVHVMDVRKPEELDFGDRVIKFVFDQIDSTSIIKNLAVGLKFAVLKQLRLIEKSQNAIRNLLQVKNYMSPTIIRVACGNVNPSEAMKEWVKLLATVGNDMAYKLSLMDEASLQKAYAEKAAKAAALEQQAIIIEQLREKFLKKFRTQDE